MQTVYSPEPLAEVDWHQRPDGSADIRLHDDIRREEDQDGNPVWVAEEVYVVADMTRAEAEEAFGELWHRAELEAVPMGTRLEWLEGNDEGMAHAIGGLASIVSETREELASTDSDLMDAVAELGTYVADVDGAQRETADAATEAVKALSDTDSDLMEATAELGALVSEAMEADNLAIQGVDDLAGALHATGAEVDGIAAKQRELEATVAALSEQIQTLAANVARTNDGLTRLLGLAAEAGADSGEEV